jgi:hypothetical protein
MGSFRNLKISGWNEPVTISLGHDLQWPAVGDEIEVTGVLRGGRLLTSSWIYVARGS